MILTISSSKSIGPDISSPFGKGAHEEGHFNNPIAKTLKLSDFKDLFYRIFLRWAKLWLPKKNVY